MITIAPSEHDTVAAVAASAVQFMTQMMVARMADDPNNKVMKPIPMILVTTGVDEFKYEVIIAIPILR